MSVKHLNTLVKTGKMSDIQTKLNIILYDINNCSRGTEWSHWLSEQASVLASQ
jgi:hypothetical protein